MNWKVALAVLTCSTVLMSASYTMLIPFLPMYLMVELGVDQADVNWWSGAVFSISFLIAGVMAPIWGAMADKHSRKLMAIRAAACLAISYFLGALVQSPMQLFWVRVFQGLSAGLWPATLAIMSSYAPQKRLGFCMGVMQAGLTAGGVLGPLVGGLLADYLDMRTTFMVAAVALGLITTIMVFVIKEPKRVKTVVQEKKDAPARPSPLRIPVVQRMLFAAAVVQMSILLTQPVLPLYIAELQGSMDRIVLISGIVFSIVGISGVIASPPWGMLGQSWGYRPVLYLTIFLSGIFGIVQAIPHDLVQFTIWRFIGGLTFAGIFPAINAVLTQSTDPADRGKVFGYSYSVQQFGSVLGPILGGALATWFSNQVAIAAAGIVLFPVVAVLYFFRPKNPAPATGAPLEAVVKAVKAEQEQKVQDK
ncbi:MAG: MFS transporter [Sutterellaceae bacterium]|nr:MFS transporter [Sutterellaceae bacterium]